MIAGLPVHWLPTPGARPPGLADHDHVYVRGADGSEPLHPLRVDHVHWQYIASYAVAHDSHDQPAHHIGAYDPTIQVLYD